MCLPGKNDASAACTHVRARKPGPPGRRLRGSSPLFACCGTFCSGLQQPVGRQEGQAVVAAAIARCSRRAFPIVLFFLLCGLVPVL